MIEYILIATIVLLTGSIWGWAIPAITILQIVLSVVYFLYKKGFYKLQIQKSNLIIVGVLLTVYILNMVVISHKNIFSKSYVLILAEIICLFMISESINRNNFIRKYINVTFVLSAMSLIFWVLAQKGIMIAPKIVDPGNGIIYRMNWFYIYRASSDIPTFNEFNARNFGIFWEGGVFQAFLNIALFWLIDQKNHVRYFLIKAIIFVITIITTFSTIGYFILVLNSLYYVNKKWGKLSFKKIIMFFGAFALAAYILSTPAVVNKFSSDSSSYISYKIRANDNINGIKVALYSPIWGLGYLSDNYFSTLENVGITANSSGLLVTAQEFGIIFMLFLLYNQCKNFSLIFSNKKLSTVIIPSAILLLIFSSEALMLYEFFLLWAFRFTSEIQFKERNKTP